MKKLQLDLDTLVVESFDTVSAGGRGRGTVLGHSFVRHTDYETCVREESFPCALSDDDPTCQISCGQESVCHELLCMVV